MKTILKNSCEKKKTWFHGSPVWMIANDTLRGIPGKGWFVEHFALMIELTRMLANLQLGWRVGSSWGNDPRFRFRGWFQFGFFRMGHVTAILGESQPFLWRWTTSSPVVVEVSCRCTRLDAYHSWLPTSYSGIRRFLDIYLVIRLLLPNRLNLYNPQTSEESNSFISPSGLAERIRTRLWWHPIAWSCSQDVFWWTL